MKLRVTRPKQKRKTVATSARSDGGRGRAELAATFRRPGAEAEGFAPADIGCPDCRGVLYVTELGNQGFLSFRCRVGHVFSADSLVEFKEDRLDEALWTALELLDELVQLHTVFALRESGGKELVKGSAAKDRIARAARHHRALRKLIRTEGPAPRRQPDRQGEST